MSDVKLAASLLLHVRSQPLSWVFTSSLLAFLFYSAGLSPPFSFFDTLILVFAKVQSALFLLRSLLSKLFCFILMGSGGSKPNSLSLCCSLSTDCWALFPWRGNVQGEMRCGHQEVEELPHTQACTSTLSLITYWHLEKSLISSKSQ